MLDLIEAHRSTIVFANSRRLAERLCGRLNELATERAWDRAGGDGGEPGRPPAVAAARANASGEGRPTVRRNAAGGRQARRRQAGFLPGGTAGSWEMAGDRRPRPDLTGPW